jgi:hypothetical protein
MIYDHYETLKNQMMGFEGSFPSSLVILYRQSVSINRGLYIRVHNFQWSKLLFRFRFVLKGPKDHDNDLSVFSIIILILRLVCIKREESIVTVRCGLLRQLNNKADEWLSCLLFLMNIPK